MCGIVGYIGKNLAAPFLLDGLESLEYRGYDSAGIAVCEESEIKVLKNKGRLKDLRDLIKNVPPLTGCMGIGHTRWATHGKPSIVNSHPHVSQSGKFAIVHNGIIENYIPLKDELISKGVKFTSETDTEVVIQLVEHYYNGNLQEAVEKTLSRIEGSYSLLIISQYEKDKIIAAKKDNPLIIGFGDGENFIASDVTALISKTKKAIRLEDNEMAIIKADEIKVYDKNGNAIEKSPFTIDWDICAAEKCGYDHFMLKEIMEQPKAIRDTIHPRIKNGNIEFDNFSLSKEDIENISKIFIVACGSAYHVGCIAKCVFEKMLRKPVEVEIASEFRYGEPIIDESVLVIAISQSGETADTLAALKEAKKLGAQTLSIVNVIGSSIANCSDNVIYTWAGPEIAVATTKAYSTQLSIVYLLSIYMADKIGAISKEKYNEYLNELNSIPDKIEKILNNVEDIKYFASKYYQSKDVFFIGRNLDYAVSLEASLKLKEISYIHSDAYGAGELKHGPISLIEDGTLVIALATNDKLFDKMISNMGVVKARGAIVLGVTTEKHKEIGKVSDLEFFIPETIDIMTPMLSIIPMQLFAYYVAFLKNCDIDKPRNLAKSVTVE